MLALPVSKGKLALTKFLVLLSFLAIELLIFFSSFIIAGVIATKIMNVTETIPVLFTNMDSKIICDNGSSYCLYVDDYCTI